MVEEDIRSVLQAAVGHGRERRRHRRCAIRASAGTFPRVLGRFVREQHWLTLPEAIRKMTSAPADRLRLEGARRELPPGTCADLVLLRSGRR